jgi:hypothetical protein
MKNVWLLRLAQKRPLAAFFICALPFASTIILFGLLAAVAFGVFIIIAALFIKFEK